MHLPKYPYRTNESFLDYEFVSEGPKGKIKKVVRFMQLSRDVYNLGFGDLDETTGDISDTVITDNKDSAKVLATVAGTIYDFYSRYPNTFVLIRGSTPSRTRLYQIGIGNNRHEIETTFDVFGYRNDGWERFALHRNYEAFLVTLKKA